MLIKPSKEEKCAQALKAGGLLPSLGLLFEASFESFCSYFRTNNTLIFILGVLVFGFWWFFFFFSFLVLLKLNPGTELSLQNVKFNIFHFKHMETK